MRMVAFFILWLSSISFAEDADKFAPILDKVKICASCHGEQGKSTQDQYPILAGQNLHYLYVQLKDYKSGLRENPIMQPMVAALEKQELLLIAEYFSLQKWPSSKAPAATKEATSIALKMINSGQCVACHLGNLKGNSRIPRISNQHANYSYQTLLNFKQRLRKNSPAKNALIETYSEAQLKAMAEYLASFRE